MKVQNRRFDPCNGDLHKDHLCYIVSQALHLTEKLDYDDDHQDRKKASPCR